MEKFLFNRRLGAVVLAASLLLALLYGPGRSLSGLRAKTEDIFTNGVNGDGLSISRDLDQRVQLSYNLQTVAKRYLPEGDALLSGLTGAASGLSAAQGPGEKFRANLVLEDAFLALYGALGELPLSEQDAGFRARLYDDFVSRGKTISHDGYNQAASEFNQQVLGTFPANVLGTLAGVEPLELYQ